MNAGAELQQRGVALWLDTLGRDQLGSGEFAELIRDCSVTGVALDAGELLAGVATAKVRHACDELGPVFDGAERADGYASIAIDPQLAGDVAATVAAARRLASAVDRPNLLIRIPATEPGLIALADCVADGLGVHATLIFGMRRYAQVIDAYIDGLERLRAAGGDVGAVACVASFAFSNLGAQVSGARIASDVGVADARLAYSLFQQSLSLPRWSALAAAGARPQRPLFASIELAERGVIIALSAPAIADLARAEVSS